MLLMEFSASNTKNTQKIILKIKIFKFFKTHIILKLQYLQYFLFVIIYLQFHLQYFCRLEEDSDKINYNHLQSLYRKILYKVIRKMIQFQIQTLIIKAVQIMFEDLTKLNFFQRLQTQLNLLSNFQINLFINFQTNLIQQIYIKQLLISLCKMNYLLYFTLIFHISNSMNSYLCFQQISYNYIYLNFLIQILLILFMQKYHISQQNNT
ncbi:transmembrane protein, putative (macronuclear) [Tetrahymena thermophila SB210]|uniref:Transmembrane protein, putative n=1 Tax=Tetrahymena thermophila (strain SB210) TaxID=312017 RepID=W7XFT9_TETTS|nr:transmembrane protein, putative [Tetrahymena thermophila SB210]EWS72886.1 transmembrane protein, putative [Tetrahymena thermophila SB210]|eukprot:XP_012654583.1 transmembrane protein, putative [Tetrahymena thermophila SB210]